MAFAIATSRLRYIVAATLAVALSAGAVEAQTGSSEPGVRRLYDTARQCYVANGYVYSTFKNSGDTANARLFQSHAEKAFELAYFYGNMLRLSRQQVTHDLEASTNLELPRLTRDSGYLTTVAGTCRAAGLM